MAMWEDIIWIVEVSFPSLYVIFNSETVNMAEQRQETIIKETELAHIAEGTSAVFIGRVLDGGFRYLYTLIVAKILGPKSFGIFMLGFIQSL